MKDQFMKVSGIPAQNVFIKRQHKVILKFMKDQLMKVSSIPAHQCVVIKQEHRGIFKFTIDQFMEEQLKNKLVTSCV